jgi:hypothetical protein
MGEGRERWVDAAFAASLANLATINGWALLLHASEANRYYLPRYGREDYAAALLLLVGGTAAAWLAVTSVRRIASRWLTPLATAAALLLLVNPLEYLRESLGVTRLELFQLLFGHAPLVNIAVGVAIAVAAGAVLRFRRSVTRAAFVAVAIVAPLAPMNAAQLAYAALTAEALRSDTGRRAGGAPGGAAAVDRRIVWIVFDELDYRLAFPDRPDSIDLPELDRLRSEAFFATHAREASDSTLHSLPSLLLGLPVAGAGPKQGGLSVTPGSAITGEEDERRGPALDFATAPGFPSEVTGRGLGLALVGLYHPYCRTFGELLRSCHWEPFVPGGSLRIPEGFSDALASQAYKALPVLAYRGEHIASIRRTLASATELATDPSLDVAFLHLPIPHSPHVYDQLRERMTLFNFRKGAYYEQLVLTDRTFGHLRRAMEAAGVWERTSVLVTSDHGWRFAEKHDTRRDHRVPFILKLAGRSEPLTYERPFPGWLAKDLLLAVADGEVRTAAAAARWLNDSKGPRAHTRRPR